MTISEFWEFFRKATSGPPALYSTESLTNRVYERLKRIDQSLGLEISELDSEGERELIISANGHTALFDRVIEIVNRAPIVPGWRFTALRPARGFDFVYRQAGQELRPLEWSFMPLRDENGDLGICVFVPGNRCIMSNAVLETIIQIGIGEESFAKIEYVEYTQSLNKFNTGKWLLLESLGYFLSRGRAKEREK